jgi:hypothetical protein
MVMLCIRVELLCFVLDMRINGGAAAGGGGEIDAGTKRGFLAACALLLKLECGSQSTAALPFHMDVVRMQLLFYNHSCTHALNSVDCLLFPKLI